MADHSRFICWSYNCKSPTGSTLDLLYVHLSVRKTGSRDNAKSTENIFMKLASLAGDYARLCFLPI
jgi:hypothetical protein